MAIEYTTVGQMCVSWELRLLAVIDGSSPITLLYIVNLWEPYRNDECEAMYLPNQDRFRPSWPN